MQPHLKKCFEGIDSLKFSESLVITAMHSVEGEAVSFSTPVGALHILVKRGVSKRSLRLPFCGLLSAIMSF